MVYKDRESLRPKGLALCSRALFAFLFVFFFSCKSVPTPEKFYAGRTDPFTVTAEGAELYFAALLPAARPLIEKMTLGSISGAAAGDFIDHAGMIIAAVYPEHSPRRFIGAAQGKFPSARGGIYMSGSRDWEKAVSASGIEYWRSGASNLSLYLGARRVFFSDGDPFAPPPGAVSPAALDGLKRNAVLYGWLENAGESLDKIIASLGVPLSVPAQKLLFAVYPAGSEEDAYRAVLRLETPGVSQAMALTRILGMAAAGLAGADLSAYREFESVARALFGGSFEQSGDAVIITTMTLRSGELALLFTTLTLY
ncbi:MAG: hypothetical protein LBB82_10445 [Treponema sp.]|jgi:hypothetical protein|nr:hypothetical protein [Treponema sp.]